MKILRYSTAKRSGTAATVPTVSHSSQGEEHVLFCIPFVIAQEARESNRKLLFLLFHIPSKNHFITILLPQNSRFTFKIFYR